MSLRPKCVTLSPPTHTHSSGSLDHSSFSSLIITKTTDSTYESFWNLIPWNLCLVSILIHICAHPSVDLPYLTVIVCQIYLYSPCVSLFFACIRFVCATVWFQSFVRCSTFNKMQTESAEVHSSWSSPRLTTFSFRTHHFSHYACFCLFCIKAEVHSCDSSAWSKMSYTVSPQDGAADLHFHPLTACCEDFQVIVSCHWFIMSQEKACLAVSCKPTPWRH